MRGQSTIEESNEATVDYKMAHLGRLMLIAGAWALQAYLTAALDAGKDIQQVQNVGVKGRYPPALDCGSRAVLSVLIGTLLSAVECAEGYHAAGLLLVVRVLLLLTLLLLCAAAFHQRMQRNLAHWSKAGVPLGVRRVAPGEKAGLPTAALY